MKIASLGSTRKWIPVLFTTLVLLAAIATNPAYAQDATMTAVTPNPSTVAIGDTITFTATVTDTAASPTTPTGTVTWGDGSAGGTFSSGGSCTPTLASSSSATCKIDYTPPSVAEGVTITATYVPDATHLTSSGSSTLTVTLRTTSTTVLPGSATVIIGNTITFTATVADTSSGTATTPSGTVSWSDGSAGGTFSGLPCTLSSGSCTVTYTPSTTPGSVTITAMYSGDSTHATSSGTSALTVQTPAQAAQDLINAVNSLNLPHGLTNSLDVKLQAAINSLGRGNKGAASNQLNAFLNELSAKCCNKPPAKPLTTAQDSMLVADAQQIIKAIA